MSVYRPTWTALVSEMSDKVVARLLAAGLPPLTPELDGSPGAIQIGPQFVNEQGSPPRILFLPKQWGLEPTRDAGNFLKGGKVSGGNTQEPRAIGVQWKQFEVQCWGCAFADALTPAPDPALDYDAAQVLSEIVWQAAQALCAGVWRSKFGTVDLGAPSLLRVGRVFVFDLALSTPIPDVALPYAPEGVAPGLQPPLGVGISINGAPPANPNQ
jgi:hypothetical protein